jgi:hypothetical protein
MRSYLILNVLGRALRRARKGGLKDGSEISVGIEASGKGTYLEWVDIIVGSTGTDVRELVRGYVMGIKLIIKYAQADFYKWHLAPKAVLGRKYRIPGMPIGQLFVLLSITRPGHK